MHKPELLAPAGGVEALHAAVRGGADAVYLGLENFNARRNAGNFTLEGLSHAAAYAHLRGVSVYITLNTAVLPHETDEALECARQAYRAGADAFIVQDIGLASEIARTIPSARLHVSTQMNIHNAAGIRAAARLGANRVTLARELSLAEVTALAREAAAWNMEVETFAHGALCVCYSGQCFMSSLIGGRSANRGLCAQACRLPYSLGNRAVRKALPSPGDHLLSPQDLCTIELLPQLIETGTASLKIEGRMKSPDYVFAVTSAYRAALDRATEFCAFRESCESCESCAASEERSADVASAAVTEAGAAGTTGTAGAAGADATATVATEYRVSAAEKRALEESFSRGFTTAYLEGKRGNDIMSYQRPNNRGAFIGRVAAMRDGAALVAGEYDLSEGDVLEFWTGRGHVAQTLGKTNADTQGRAIVPLDAKAARSVRTGDRVFRVRSAKAAFEDDPLEPRIPISGIVSLKLGRPLRMEFRLAGQAPAPAPNDAKGVAVGEVVEQARTKAVTKDDVRTHIDRLGSTPFRLSSLAVELDENVGIGFSQIHRVRAQAIENLARALLAPYESRTLHRVKARARHAVARTPGCRIAAWTTNPVCAKAAIRAGADLVYVPTLNFQRGEAVIAGQLSETGEQVRYPQQCLAAVPVVEHDSVPPAREAVLGFDPWHRVGTTAEKHVFADSLGAMQRAGETGLSFDVGPHVPITNRLSLQTAADFGAARVWLSPELTLAQIRDLAQETPVELGLFIIGAQELMITEHCLLMSQGPCDQNCARCARRKSPHYLRDRKDFEFPVITDAVGRSHLYNSVPLDVAQAMPELLGAGVSSFMVDATLMNSEETSQAVARAKRALTVAQNDGNALAKMPGTTTGHLFRGVS